VVYAVGMKNDDTDNFIPVARAAIKLRVNPRWLTQEAREGRIPSLDCAGQIMVNLPAVRQTLAQRAIHEGLAGDWTLTKKLARRGGDE